MSYAALRILTYVLGIIGTALVLPLAVALHEGERDMIAVYAVPMAAAWVAAATFFFRARAKPKVVGIQDAFALAGAVWVAICVFGAIPLYFSGSFPSITDAMFESVSGFTTTGATVSSDVDSLKRSINLWRCQTHWLGGMGVVALAVAMIPMLGAGGFRLIKAETTGPDKGKLTSSIASTAKILWFVYVGMTGLLASLLWYSGMDVVDAVSHAFSTISTGGFSTRTGSLGAFNLPAAEWLCIFFMMFSSVNFILYCRLFSTRALEFFRNSELRAFAAVVLVSTLVVVAVRSAGQTFSADILRQSAFQVVAVTSTTGFMTSDYITWPVAAQVVIVALCFVGGCSGSTSGGIKVIRWTVLGKQLVNEIRRLVHPYRVFTLRIDSVSGREAFVPAVAAFIFAYFILVIAGTFIGAFAGLDILTAFSGSLSMVGNIGPAFGSLGPSMDYGHLPAFLKWWYMVAMLAGRLEIYTLLIMLGFLARRR